ncbi:hypothetical protein Taro_027914 [Colocasia esculenta]|uniref:Non-specific phospholipase C6 n=1 Tax=Colocasia esculenta TaxID=4460 RepID=A0A843VLI8_COLES|nr:hypothetical protein [Colocasia esculenta]
MARTRARPHLPLLSSLVLLLLTTAGSHGAQQPIKNVVVLVLENRSFDHMLGWMKRSVNPAINGLTGAECNRVTATDPSSPPVCVSDDAQFVVSDPGHSFEAVLEQVFGSTGSLSGAGVPRVPSMSGFVQQASTVSPNLTRAVMRAFRPEKLPVYAALVREFAVFDRWFSSIPGPTQPNRLFVYSATSHGATSHVKTDMARGYPQRSIFDSLYDAGLDFGIYAESIPSTLFFRNLRKLKYAFKFHRFGAFKEHARQGRLRSLSVVEPRYFDLLGEEADDDHPAHDVANGQRLVKEVYEALRGSPQWNQSLLIITYDEHGGFFDHVATPYRGVPSPDGIRGPAPFHFAFDRLGVRVPTIMVSPWIKKGMVVSRANGPTGTSEYEHSSIPATIRRLFDLNSPFLTRRDAWAGTFEHVVAGLASPRTDCPEFLPDVESLRQENAREDVLLSEFQSELLQLAADLHGDEELSKYLGEAGKNMTVKEASDYVSNSFFSFLQVGQQALSKGVDEDAVVNVGSSLATKHTAPRTTIHL